MHVSSKARNSRPSITSLRSPIRCCYRCATHERGERIRTELSKEKLQESHVSDASHETESCEHTGTRAGCR